MSVHRDEVDKFWEDTPRKMTNETASPSMKNCMT